MRVGAVVSPPARVHGVGTPEAAVPDDIHDAEAARVAADDALVVRAGQPLSQPVAGCLLGRRPAVQHVVEGATLLVLAGRAQAAAARDAAAAAEPVGGHDHPGVGLHAGLGGRVAAALALVARQHVVRQGQRSGRHRDRHRDRHGHRDRHRDRHGHRDRRRNGRRDRDGLRDVERRGGRQEDRQQGQRSHHRRQPRTPRRERAGMGLGTTVHDSPWARLRELLAFRLFDARADEIAAIWLIAPSVGAACRLTPTVEFVSSVACGALAYPSRLEWLRPWLCGWPVRARG